MEPNNTERENDTGQANIHNLNPQFQSPTFSTQPPHSKQPKNIGGIPKWAVIVGAVSVVLFIVLIIVLIIIGVKATNKDTSIGTTAASQSKSWRDPNIAKEITSAGQTISHQTQVTVGANVDWVDTGLSINSGQHLWSDTRGDGTWSGNPQYFAYSDANGLTTYPGGYKIDSKANVLSLIGFVGANPPNISEQSISVGAQSGGPGGITDPGFFEPGNTLKNFTPTKSGEVWLRNNDNTNLGSDVGQQIAKVFVTSNK